jgi:hypothetical protein
MREVGARERVRGAAFCRRAVAIGNLLGGGSNEQNVNIKPKVEDLRKRLSAFFPIPFGEISYQTRNPDGFACLARR